MKKAAVIQFPGNNCELETLRALKDSGFDAELFRWNQKPAGLKKYDFLVLEGGFGYEDRGRSGLIISFDPIMEEIKKLAKKGTIVLGVCNGAQALVESGLIPGVANDTLSLALAKNKRIKNGEVIGTGFYSTWVNVKSVTSAGRSPFNFNIPEKQIIALPIAHGEGRFTSAVPDLEHVLFENQQVLFQYCSEEGAIIDEYPINPNGSRQNIAAICNPAGNIMAIMPHPERGIQAPGKIIFDSVHSYLEEKKHKKTYVKYPKELDVKVKEPSVSTYKPKRTTLDIYIELLITDNEEFTVQHTFNALKIAPVTLKKYRFVSIQATKTIPVKTIEKMIQHEYFSNSQKELCHIKIASKWHTVGNTNLLVATDENPLDHPTLRVQYITDTEGMALTAVLQKKFKSLGVTSVDTGLAWKLCSSKKLTKKVLKDIVHHRLFWNQHSQIASIIE